MIWQWVMCLEQRCLPRHLKRFARANRQSSVCGIWGTTMDTCSKEFCPQSETTAGTLWKPGEFGHFSVPVGFFGLFQHLIHFVYIIFLLLLNAKFRAGNPPIFFIPDLILLFIFFLFFFHLFDFFSFNWLNPNQSYLVFSLLFSSTDCTST